LSNREVRTAQVVAAHLRRLGLKVQTGVAHTGVVGLLEGALPGPLIALRADMDALPITERTTVPFRSKATSTYRGETVGVMHACGHDAHTAILMGVAQTLAGLRDSLPGKVLFIFQPAEEGPPDGESGGASLVLSEGLFERYRPQAVFGLHITTALSSGEIGYRAGPVMAGSDSFRINVLGRQTHAARPWRGVDPIVTAAQIINGLQTIVSRRLDLTEYPAVIGVSVIHGGTRHNVVPSAVEMLGTIRSFVPEQRAQIIEEIQRVVAGAADANGAQAEFAIDPHTFPVTVNHQALTRRMLPSLQRAADGKAREVPLTTGAEDFSYYAQRVPGLFFFIGVTPAGTDPRAAPTNHSDLFFLDEASLPIGVRALTSLAIDFLAPAAKADAYESEYED
jgi:amidohydrolase